MGYCREIAKCVLRMVAVFLVYWLIVLLFSDGVKAAPWVISDAVNIAQKPTHCGVWLDALAKSEAPVASDPVQGVFCKIDVGSVAVGSHTLKLSFIVKDPVWGNLESEVSAPFPFVRPVLPAVPSLITLSPSGVPK